MLVQFVPVQKESAYWYKKLLEQSCLYRYKYQGVIISFLIDVSTEGLLSVSTVSNFFHCQHLILFIVSTRFFPLKHPFKNLLLALGNIVYTLKKVLFAQNNPWSGSKVFVPVQIVPVQKYQGVIISFSAEGLLSVSTVSNFFHCQHSILFIVSTRFFPLIIQYLLLHQVLLLWCTDFCLLLLYTLRKAKLYKTFR